MEAVVAMQEAQSQATDALRSLEAMQAAQAKMWGTMRRLIVLQEAQVRAWAVVRCEAYCQAREGWGARWSTSERRWCKDHGVAWRTLQRWRRAYKRGGVAALLDGRKTKQT
jgi:hypothetical protein